MPDGDWTDDLSRRQIRAQERFSRRPEDFRTLYQGQPVPAPFSWDTQASKDFLKAVMAEMIAQVALSRVSASLWCYPDGSIPREYSRKRDELEAGWASARVDRHRAFEILCDEMRQKVERDHEG